MEGPLDAMGLLTLILWSIWKQGTIGWLTIDKIKWRRCLRDFRSKIGKGFSREKAFVIMK